MAILLGADTFSKELIQTTKSLAEDGASQVRAQVASGFHEVISFFSPLIFTLFFIICFIICT